MTTMQGGSSASLKAFDQLASAKRQARGTPVPMIPLAQILPMAGQPRKFMDPDALAELAESIKAHGVIQPIVLIPRKHAAETDVARYAIVVGERRFRAAALAGLDAIPALVRDYEEDEVALLALLENLQREDLTPLEEGEYLVQLKLQYGFTEEQLGERLGKSRDYVHMRTRLLNLSPDLLSMWREATTPEVYQTLTPSHAILVNQLGDASERLGLARAVVAEGLTVAETRRRLEHVKVVPAELSLVEREQRVKAAIGGAVTAPLPPKAVAKKRVPQADAVAPTLSTTTGPRLALEDLALYNLFAPLIRSGATDVPLHELMEALESDAAWTRRLVKNGLTS